MNIRHFVEYVIFRFGAWTVQTLGLKTAQRLGAFLGEFVFKTLGYRKAITLNNLHNAFPDSDGQELYKLARRAFRSVGIAVFELLRFPRFSLDTIEKTAVVENPEFMKEIKSRGKGAILLTAHFGNWELLAQAVLASTGFPVWIVVKPQTNPLVDKKINEWRTRFGNKIIPMGVAIREFLRALQQGEFVGIVADQTAPMESIPIEFFGRMVPTHEGPAVFCLKTGAPMLIGFAVRQYDGTYKARFQEVPTSNLRGYNEKNVAELTRRHVQMTERIIRQYPDQWMWMHKRWKHVPDRIPSILTHLKQ